MGLTIRKGPGSATRGRGIPLLATGLRGVVCRTAPLTFLALTLSLAAVLAVPIARFDAGAALQHVRQLSASIGVRGGGSEGERRAAEYIIGCMQSYGYAVRRQAVPLPNGLRSENLIFDKPGRRDWTWIVGGHMDSKPPSPGANDNGSGVATLLELARVLRHVPTEGAIRFIFFGTEEVQNNNPEWHHFGSRWYVANMTAEERSQCGGMICVDAVAAGPHFVIGSMKGKSPLARDLRLLARKNGCKVLAQTDPGWSDHEPFEDQGFSVAYIRWRVDPTLHTRKDNYAHVQAWKIAMAGNVVLQFLTGSSTRYPGPTSCVTRREES